MARSKKINNRRQRWKKLVAAALCAASFAGGQLLLGEESSSQVILNQYQKSKQAVAAPPLTFPAPARLPAVFPTTSAEPIVTPPISAPLGILNPFVSSKTGPQIIEESGSPVQLAAHSSDGPPAAQAPESPTLIEARPLPLAGINADNSTNESQLPPIIPASAMPSRPARKALATPLTIALTAADTLVEVTPPAAPSLKQTVLLESKFQGTNAETANPAAASSSSEPAARPVVKSAAQPGSWIDDLRQALGGQSRHKLPEIQQASAATLDPPAPTIAAPEKEKFSNVEANNPLRSERRPTWERVGIRSAQPNSEPTLRPSIRRKGLPSPWSTLKAWERATPVAEGE